MSVPSPSSSTSPTLQRETPSNSPYTPPKKGFLNKLANLFSKKENPSVVEPPTVPLKRRSLTLTTEHIADSIAKEKGPSIGEITPPSLSTKAARRKSLDLTAKSKMGAVSRDSSLPVFLIERRNSDRSRTSSVTGSTTSPSSSNLSTPPSPLIQNSDLVHLPALMKIRSTTSVADQLVLAYSVLTEIIPNTTERMAIRYFRNQAGTILVRDNNKFYWKSGKEQDESDSRKDALETILRLIYISLLDSVYTFMGTHLEMEGGKLVKKTVEEPVGQLAYLLFDNHGTRQMMIADKKRGLTHLWIKILFKIKFQANFDANRARLDLLKQTTLPIEQITKAIGLYQLSYVNKIKKDQSQKNGEFDFKNFLFPARFVEGLSRSQYQCHKDSEAPIKAFRAIVAEPKLVWGTLIKQPENNDLSKFIEDSITTSILYDNLLDEMQTEDPTKKEPFIKYFITRFSKGSPLSKDWLTDDMKERIEKGAKFYSERAYLQCFECITQQIETMKNKQDEDLNWALFQIASQGLFIIKDRGIVTQEKLDTLRKNLNSATDTLRETLKSAKDNPKPKDLATLVGTGEDWVALLKSIADEITILS